MDNIKDRWQFLIGYIAIIISLSAFKDELKEIHLDFSFIKFNLSQFLFVLIISFTIIIHTYIIPYIFSTTKYSKILFLKNIEYLSYIIFTLIVFSPSILLLAFFIQFLFKNFNQISKYDKNIVDNFILIIVGAYIILTILNSFKKRKKITKNLLLENMQEVKMFETTLKLHKEKLYNQSLVESFKLMEKELYNYLLSENFIYGKQSFNNLLKVIENKKLYNPVTIDSIQNLMILRNKAVHEINIEISKEQSENAISLIKEVININRSRYANQ